MFFLNKLSAMINRGIEYLVFGLGLSMALIVALQVFFRYGLNQSLFWSEELARYLLVWLTFLGASAAYFRGAHPGVDVFVNRMSQSRRRAMALLTHLISIGLFSVMIVYGCRFAYFVRLQASPALQVPKWIILMVIPVSGVIFLIHGLGFLLNEWNRSGHDG